MQSLGHQACNDKPQTGEHQQDNTHTRTVISIASMTNLIQYCNVVN